MKIKYVKFGAAVNFRGGSPMTLAANPQQSIEFIQGIFWLTDISTGKRTGVFTTNVQYFDPEDEQIVIEPSSGVSDEAVKLRKKTAPKE